jgi:RNA polymerase sigma factor (sigma-70 family)
MPDSSTSLTTNNQPTDEQLIDAYRSGDQSALDVLFSRYLTKILTWLFGKSFFNKDEDYLSDVRDEIFLKVCQGIRDGKFQSQGPGSFSAWLYTIAELECLNADKKRRRSIVPFSQVFPESDSESASPEDNILFKVTSNTSDIEYARIKLERAFKNLKPEEVKLLKLSVRMKYQDIIKLREFSKYKSVDSLKHKVYDIMDKIRKIPKD